MRLLADSLWPFLLRLVFLLLLVVVVLATTTEGGEVGRGPVVTVVVLTCSFPRTASRVESKNKQSYKNNKDSKSYSHQKKRRNECLL